MNSVICRTTAIYRGECSVTKLRSMSPRQRLPLGPSRQPSAPFTSFQFGLRASLSRKAEPVTLRNRSHVLPSNVAKNQKKAAKLVQALPGAGHLSSAILNLTLGFLTVLFASGLRRESPDARSVLETLRAQPFGPVLLLIISAGYCSLVLFRLLQATDDFDGKSRWGAALFRIRYFFGACVC